MILQISVSPFWGFAELLSDKTKNFVYIGFMFSVKEKLADEIYFDTE